MSLATTFNLLKAAFFTPTGKGEWGLPLCFLGEPGTVKTAGIVEFCALWSIPIEVLSPGERGEGAFGVVPVPAEDENGDMVLAYPAPQWTSKFTASGRGLVFVDEIIDCPPGLRAPLMGLFLGRRIGGKQLPLGVRRMAAGNPVELSANGYELPPALANRMGHIRHVKPTVEEHTSYQLRGDDDFGVAEAAYNADDEEARVKKVWAGFKAQAVGLETAFLKRRSALKNLCPGTDAAKAAGIANLNSGGPWPSDRSWENATRAFAGAKMHGLSQSETETFVAAFISEKVAAEWFTWMIDADLPDPEKLLDGKEKWSHNPTRLDRTIAVFQSCTALVTPKAATKRNDRAAALWGMLEEMTASKADKDLIVPSVTALIEADLHAMKDAAKTLAAIQPILKAAGITPRRR